MHTAPDDCVLRGAFAETRAHGMEIGDRGLGRAVDPSAGDVDKAELWRGVTLVGEGLDAGSGY